MTGDQLAKRLLDIKPDIPVILCTGFNEDISEEKALALGIQKFVMKPVIKNDLATTIRTVLDQNQLNWDLTKRSPPVILIKPCISIPPFVDRHEIFNYESQQIRLHGDGFYL